MITKEDRIRLAAEIAAKISEPANEGSVYPMTAGQVRGPFVYVVCDGREVRACAVVGFVGSHVVVATGGGRVSIYESCAAYTDQAEALAALAEELKAKAVNAQSDYLACCQAITKQLAEAQKAKRDVGAKK